jgi:intergrase/recombinase
MGNIIKLVGRNFRKNRERT